MPSKTDKLYGKKELKELSEPGSTTITKDDSPLSRKNKKSKKEIPINSDTDLAPDGSEITPSIAESNKQYIKDGKSGFHKNGVVKNK